MCGDDIQLSVESLSLMHYTNSRVWIEPFSVEEQCWLWKWSYGTLVVRYIMMVLARDVIDLLRHTSSTYIFGCLVVNGG
jgi:hypothetical protein